MKNPPRLILASASPQRRKLLKHLKRPFTIIPSQVHEGDANRLDAHKIRPLTVRLAVRKARDVAKKFKGQDCIVIGADTLVSCKGHILGKPADERHAREMLGTLSGRWQKVVTGVCVIRTKDMKERKGFAETRLKFAKLDERTIRKLAAKNLDKSGSYAVQKMNDRYVMEMKGDLDNVIGFPLRLVKKLLFA